MKRWGALGIIPNPVRPAFRCRLSCRISEDTADLLHFPTYQALRELGIVPCHVGIGMAEDFCQYVYGHSVFNRQTSERMPGNVRRQRLVDIADACKLLQIGVHLAVARYGQHLSALSAIRIVLVLLQEFHRVR